MIFHCAQYSTAQASERRDALLSQASTFLSCAFCEQEDDQATLPILLMPCVVRIAQYNVPSKLARFLLREGVLFDLPLRAIFHPPDPQRAKTRFPPSEGLLIPQLLQRE